MRFVLFALALLGPPLPALAQAVPTAVVTDPIPDAAHPPRSQQVVIPSPGPAGRVEMNALFYLAGGAGPHPTVILFHGFPGNE